MRVAKDEIVRKILWSESSRRIKHGHANCFGLSRDVVDSDADADYDPKVI